MQENTFKANYQTDSHGGILNSNNTDDIFVSHYTRRRVHILSFGGIALRL